MPDDDGATLDPAPEPALDADDEAAFEADLADELED
jgi:hypothetical protein